MAVKKIKLNDKVAKIIRLGGWTGNIGAEERFAKGLA